MWAELLHLKPSQWIKGDFVVPSNGKTLRVENTKRMDNKIWTYTMSGVLQIFDKDSERIWPIIRIELD